MVVGCMNHNVLVMYNTILFRSDNHNNGNNNENNLFKDSKDNSDNDNIKY